MKTFSQFIAEGKKKKAKIERLKSAYLAGREQAPRQAVNYGDSAPNSPERASQIKAMMANSGGGAVRRAIQQRDQKAEKAAKNILKQQEGFSYGSKSFQQQFEKKRNQEAEEKQTQRQQNADSARRAFRTKGVPFSDAKGKGHIVNGVKQYDT